MLIIYKDIARRILHIELKQENIAKYKLQERGIHKLIYEMDIVGNNQTIGLGISNFISD